MNAIATSGRRLRYVLLGTHAPTTVATLRARDVDLLFVSTASEAMVLHEGARPELVLVASTEPGLVSIVAELSDGGTSVLVVDSGPLSATQVLELGRLGAAGIWDGRDETWTAAEVDARMVGGAPSGVHRAQDRFRRLLRSVPAAVWTLNLQTCHDMLTGDAGGRDLEASLARCSTAVRARPLNEQASLYDEPGPVIGEALLRAWFSGDRSPRIEVHLTARGDARSSLVSASMPATGDFQNVLVVGLDTTAHRELTRALVASQRLEAVGRLAAGIAHDFKNVLTIIRSYTDLVADEVPTDSPALEDLDVMREATDRATALISQLLAFSRIQPQTVARWDLNEIVAGIQKMVERPLGEDIELGLELTSFPLPLACDRSQLEQVLLNLAVNARDAMPNGGRLRFRTSLRRIADSYMHPVGFRVPPGKYACIEVSDEGLGMEPQVLERIFEPFFTTKASRGSGLGLATAYGIVKQHGGFITARSRLGAGSTFELLLPLGSAEAGPTKDTRLGRPFFPRAEVGPGRRVLLVEDDPEVRRAITHMLERKGHVVRASGDPDQVLGWLAEADTHFDVLMTDVVMPRMNGLTLAARARELRPGVAVVLMSGRDDFDELAQAGRSASVFVQKPASPELILEAIEEAMRLVGKGRKT